MSQTRGSASQPRYTVLVQSLGQQTERFLVREAGIWAKEVLMRGLTGFDPADYGACIPLGLGWPCLLHDESLPEGRIRWIGRCHSSAFLGEVMSGHGQFTEVGKRARGSLWELPFHCWSSGH